MNRTGFFALTTLTATLTIALFGIGASELMEGAQPQLASVNNAVKFKPDVINEPNIDRIKPLDAYIDKVPDNGKLLVIDLATDEVSMFENGNKVSSAQVKSQGEDGSFWQTPTGYYTITYKNPNHVSSIGNVAMPYSLQYSGNFFIHGWPTYLNGTSVEQGYSGGCIRLSTSDAKKVFDFAPSNTKVLVVDTSTLSSKADLTSNRLTTSDKTNFPNLSAKSWLVSNTSSGNIIRASADIDSRSYDLGAIGNFLIAFTANEWVAYNTKVPQYSPLANGGFTKTSTALVPKHIYPELLNDSPEADAKAYSFLASQGREYFKNKIVDKSKAIGMISTDITVSDNLVDIVATPKDTYQLLRYLYYQKKFLLDSSNGAEQSPDDTVTFVTTGGSGLQSGFSFIPNQNDVLNPYMVIVFDSTNATAELNDIRDWLRTLNQGSQR